jgi:hypothetical protein
MNKRFLLIVSILFIFHFISYGQGCTYSGTYKTSAPIIWNGISGQTINGLDIENAPGNSIELTNCSNITIQNCRIAHSIGIGIKLYGCSNITINNCSIDSVASGVNACTCSGIKFEYNEVKNVLGPMPRGQMVQFDAINGGGNSISYNIGENIQGQSFPEDEISLYKSNGLSNDPIVIAGNWIRGGGPSNSGGGIMTGDAGGSYVLVKDNILVNPGQYGIAISSGNNITVQNNKVYSAQLAFSNVGIYAFNQYPSSCSSNTVLNNSINFTYKTGIINNTYTDGTCGTLTGWATNVYDKTLNATILPEKIIGRSRSIASPTTQASGVSFSNVTSTGFTINWTSGNGTNSLVVIKCGSVVDSDPTNGSSYTPSTAFGSGTQIGSGNYVVYNGTGNSVVISGLNKTSTYYVKVYSFNGSGGTENYLTSIPATSGYQITLMGEITSTGTNTGGSSWTSPGTWSGGIVPTASDNVTIATGDVIKLVSSTSPMCNNLTINSGGKVFADYDGSSPVYLSIYGTSLVCNGILGDKMSDGLTDSGTGIQFFGTLSISGSGAKIRPGNIRPGAGATNVSVTFASNTELTNTASAIISDNSSNDNITYNINSGITLKVDGNFSMANSTINNGNANTIVNIGGNLTINKTLALSTVSGKTCTVNVNGTLTTYNLNVAPTTAVVAPMITVGSAGSIVVKGIADFSNTNLSGYITGTGSFTLNSGACINVAAASGLDPVAGPIRTTTHIFNSRAWYNYIGTVAQTTGSNLPASVWRLSLNNVSGLSLTAPVTVNDSLELISGTLSNSTNNITLGNGATIVRTAGLLSAVPFFGTTAKVTYNGNSPITTSYELPVSSTVLNTLTINNTSGVSLVSNTNTANLTLNNGILNVSAGKQLTVSAALTNNSGKLNLLSTSADGTATILTPATLGGTGGTYSVQQNLSSIRNWYISSPLTDATTPSGYTYYKYDETGSNTNLTNSQTAYWVNVAQASTFEKGRGYIVQPVSVASPFNFTTSTGKFNSGDIPITLTNSGASKTGFNLIGNPYPSFLNISNFASNNDLEPTYWYRICNASYVYDTYNIASGIGTNNSGLCVSAYVPPMQAFWVKVKNTSLTGASITFTNSMRSHQDDPNNKFRVTSINTDQKLLRLQVSNGINSDETIVLFNPNASNDYDAYDSPKMSNANVAIPEIYTLAGIEQVAINGFKNITPDAELPLGFTTGNPNTFMLKATEISNFDDSKIILKDHLLNTQQELTVGSAYTFSSEVTNTINRFSLVFKTSAVSTDIQNKVGEDNSVTIYGNANRQLVVHFSDEIIGQGNVSVYNSVGQKLESKPLQNSTTILNDPFLSGVYLVAVSANGKKIAKKVVIN